MEPLTQLMGIVAPLDMANVDTDMIIPKQFLKSIKRSGFGPNLFDELRYLDEGEPGQDCSQRPLNHNFVLNQTRYEGASILLGRENFGCGSSREHAPWALLDYGFRCVIAPSFADIFYNNCFKNSILPISLEAHIIDSLFSQVMANDGYELTVSLEQQVIIQFDGTTIPFELDAFRRDCLLKGLDEIDLTLSKSTDIKAFELIHCQLHPWLFDTIC